jgi:hypothetical protein
MACAPPHAMGAHTAFRERQVGALAGRADELLDLVTTNVARRILD